MAHHHREAPYTAAGALDDSPDAVATRAFPIDAL